MVNQTILRLEPYKTYITKNGTVVSPKGPDSIGSFYLYINKGEEYIEWNDQGRVIYYGGSGSCFQSEDDLHIVEKFKISKHGKYMFSNGKIVTLEFNPSDGDWISSTGIRVSETQWGIFGYFPDGRHGIKKVIDYKAPEEKKEVTGPVITVTNRRIVPGTYGNLEVLNYLTTGHVDVMKQKVTFKVSECVLDCNELEKLVNDLSEILDVMKEDQKILDGSIDA